MAKIHPAAGKFIDIAEFVAGYYDKRVAEAMQYARKQPALSGYTLINSCNGGGPVSHISNINGWATSCGAAAPFVAADADMNLTTPLPRTVYYWDYVAPYINAGFSTYWRRQQWMRPLTPLPGSFVSMSSPIQFVNLPLMPPMADPMSLPLSAPLNTPQPVPYWVLPYRRPNPYRSPSEGHHFGYGTWSSRFFNVQHSTGMSFNPVVGQPTKPTPVSPPGHKPPGPGVKERKSRVRRVGAALIRAMRATTEALDFIDAVFKALPAKYRKGVKTPQDKVRAIYQHADKLDMNKVVFNLIANHYTDKLLGRANALIERPMRQHGVTHGNVLGWFS